MEYPQKRLSHSTQTSNLADILERVLDKGIVIAGDIKVKLVDIELLTIQIRLLVASVDKAKEMGMDWWVRNSDFTSKPPAQVAAPAAALPTPAHLDELNELKQRLARLEAQTAPVQAR